MVDRTPRSLVLVGRVNLYSREIQTVLDCTHAPPDAELHADEECNLALMHPIGSSAVFWRRGAPALGGVPVRHSERRQDERRRR